MRRIAQALLERGLSAQKPVAILSDNSIDHALLALGAMHVGIPAAPISPAYSLMSKDFAKLKAIFELVQPGLVYAADPQKFGPALAGGGRDSRCRCAELLETNPGSPLEREFVQLKPRDDRQDPLHLGLDRDAEGRDQHARACCARTSRCWRRPGRSSRTARR